MHRLILGFLAVHTALTSSLGIVDAMPSGALTQSAGASSEIAVGNTAVLERRDRWKWSVFLMGRDETLRQVQCVEYLLHPTFPDPRRSVCSRGALPGKGFVLNAEGWGTFTIGVKIVYRNGQIQYLRHELRFTAEAEGWQSLPATPGNLGLKIPVTAAVLLNGHFELALRASRSSTGEFTLRYEQITVQQYGPRRSARWIFEVFVNDELVWRLAMDSPSDPRSPRPPSDVKRSVPAEAVVSVRVLAHREH
jgi:YEATS family